jgi:multidrug efflux pump subunit AcrA (membrane-fusion protein)
MRAAPTAETAPDGPEAVDLNSVSRLNIPSQQVTADSADLMASLPWWVSRGLLYVVGGFVLCALVWAVFTPADDVSVARGSIIPEGEVRPLQALEAGTIINVIAHEGDTVAKGQTIAELDDSVLRSHESQARSEYEGAQVNLINLRDSGADVATINDAEAKSTQAKNNLEAIHLQIDRTHLNAPISGTVTYLSVHGAGAVVREGDVVANIAPAGARLVAEVHIPNEHIAKVHPGLPVKILVDAFPYQQYGVFDGTVLTVSPDAITSPSGESYYRAVVLPTADKLSTGVSLAPGLALEARIVTDHRTVLGLFLDPFRHVSAMNHPVKRGNA